MIGPGVVTEAGVAEIAALTNPALRNCWITEAYHRLAVAARPLLGDDATWMAFATWASKSVGETIRGDDLPGWAKERLVSDGLLGGPDGEVYDAAGLAGHIHTAARQVADQLGGGNRAVFEQIAPPAARFVATFSRVGPATPGAREEVLAGCAGAEPIRGVNRLAAGFAAYCDALTTADPQRRAQLVLTGSVQLGAQEQTRVQPFLEAGLTEGMTKVLEPGLGRVVPHHLLARLAPHLERLWDELMTSYFLVLDVPGERLRLGHDLPPPAGRPLVPPALTEARVAELRAVLAEFDRTSGTGTADGSRDWADLADRLDWILWLFRSRQQQTSLFDPPFTPEQVAELEAGEVPTGPGR